MKNKTVATLSSPLVASGHIEVDTSNGGLCVLQANGATGTVRIKASNQLNVNFALADSPTNSYSFLAMTDLATNTTSTGATPLAVAPATSAISFNATGFQRAAIDYAHTSGALNAWISQYLDR